MLRPPVLQASASPSLVSGLEQSGVSIAQVVIDSQSGLQTLLQQAAEKNPHESNPARLAQLASELVLPSDLQQEQKVSELLRQAVVLSTKSHRFAEVAVKISEAKIDFERSLLHSGETEIALYRSALKPDQSTDSFITETLNGAAVEDREELRNVLVRELLPDRHERIASLLSFAPKENSRDLKALLTEAALRNDPLTNPDEILGSLNGLRPQVDAEVLRSALTQVTAAHLAKTDDRARFYVDLAAEKQSDGSPRYSDSVRSILFQAALTPEPTTSQVYKRALKSLSHDRERGEAFELARHLIPESAKKIQEITAFSPPEQTLVHQNLLLHSMLGNPQASDPLELLKLAVSELESFGPQQEAAVSLYEAFSKSVYGQDKESHLKTAHKLLHDERGNRTFSSLAVARSAYQSALQSKLSLSEFVEPSSPSSSLGLENSSFAESPFIESLITQAPTGLKERYRAVMKHALTHNPKASDPVELLESVEEVLPKDKHRDGVLRKLYQTVAASLAQENPQAQFVYQQLDRSGAEATTLERARALLKTSLEPGLTLGQFQEKVLIDTPEEERGRIADDLVFKFYPEQAESILALTAFSGPQELTRHRELLSLAALSDTAASTAEGLTSAAVSLRSQDWRREAKEEVRQLARLSAKLKAQTDTRAAFLVSLADSRKSDGSYQVEEADNAALLYRAAIEPDLPREELLDRLSQLGRGQEEVRFLRRELAQEFFPEIAKKVSNIARYAPAEGVPKVWDELLSAFLESTKEPTPSELLSRKNGLYGSEKVFLHEAILKQQGSKNSRAQTVLEIVQSGPEELRTESIQALYQQALNPTLSDAEFVATVLNESGRGDRDRLRFSLAKEYFPQELQFVSELTSASQSEESDLEKHRALLLETAMAMPGNRDVSRLVLKACENLNSRYGEGKTKLALHRFALLMMAPSHSQAKLALTLASSESDLRREESRIAVGEAVLSGVTDLELLMQSTANAYPDDQPLLVKSIGRWLLSDPKLQVPEGWLERLEAGEFSAQEVKELVETLRAASSSSQPSTEIATEDNLIVIGHDNLEVDL